MGEDRPVKDHVQRCVGRDVRGRDIEQHVIAGALAGQFVNQFLHDIRADIIALPAMTDQRLRRTAAPTAQVLNRNAIGQPMIAQHRDMAVADRHEISYGRRPDRLRDG